MQVQLHDVQKSYRRRAEDALLPVLDHVSFTVTEGEFLCIVGPSGCGKSTLLNLLGGLDAPDAGKVSFVGRRTSSGPLTTIVWQEYSLIPWRPVLSNVAFGLEVRGVPKEERHARAREHLRAMGIEDFEKALPHQLSGGMRQRVGIARALTNDPELLLMDEPFAAVDAQTRVLLQEELLALWSREQKAIVFITHNIEEALLLGDRVLVLSPRPARIVEEIVVPFPRPRGMETEAEPRFGELRLHIWNLLRGLAKEREVAA
jgi:NitT/TauT family transport system ATP-binding protein